MLDIPQQPHPSSLLHLSPPCFVPWNSIFADCIRGTLLWSPVGFSKHDAPTGEQWMEGKKGWSVYFPASSVPGPSQWAVARLLWGKPQLLPAHHSSSSSCLLLLGPTSASSSSVSPGTVTAPQHCYPQGTSLSLIGFP